MTTFRLSENPRTSGVFLVSVRLHGVIHPRLGIDPPMFAYFDGVDTWSNWEFSKAAALRARMMRRGLGYPWAPIRAGDDAELWRCWWYAALYGAGAERRMGAVDAMREARTL